MRLKKKIQLTLLKMKIKLLKQLRKKKQTKYYIINQKNIGINTSCNFFKKIGDGKKCVILSQFFSEMGQSMWDIF